MIWASIQRMGVGAFIGSLVGTIAPVMWWGARLGLTKLHLLPPTPGEVADFGPLLQSFTASLYGTAMGVVVGAFWPLIVARTTKRR